MTVQVEDAASGMELRDLLSDTDFLRRLRSPHRSDQRFEALQGLARVFAESPTVLLQKLVDSAVEFCGADSAGVSLEEPDEAGQLRFRWIVIAGSFAQYLNGVTPRFFSPCGTCLDRGRPQLYRVTQPYYDFLGVTADPITDGMLIPWMSDRTRGTLWAVAHHSDKAFDLDDYKLLNTLADFASIAVRHHRQVEELRNQARLKASAAMANHLAHQINNPLQSLTNALYLAGQDEKQSQSYLKQASSELNRLSALVRALLILENQEG